MPMLCSAVLRFSNTVNVGTFHACEGKPGYNVARPISTWMIRRRVHKLHGRIAVSKPARDFHAKHVPGHYEIIPNGIDLERFTMDVSPFEEYRDGKLNILFVGRLEFRKGVNYLLKAYLRIKSEFPNSRLLIVGPGTRLRKRYERWVEKNRLEDVIFIGYVTSDDLLRYYQTADIFCAPATSRESFGIVLLEAMAMGKPIVATNISGYASVATDGEDSLLVPPQNDRELARALTGLLSDENLRREMGARGRQKAERYSWEHVAQRVLDYYMAVLDGSRGNTSRV